MRRRVVRFDAVAADRVRIDIQENNRRGLTRMHEVRLHGEP